MPCDQIVARAPPSALVPPHGRPFASAERAPSQRPTCQRLASATADGATRVLGQALLADPPSRRRPGRPPGGPGGPASRSPRGYPPRTARLRPGPARRGSASPRRSQRPPRPRGSRNAPARPAGPPPPPASARTVDPEPARIPHRQPAAVARSGRPQRLSAAAAQRCEPGASVARSTAPRIPLTCRRRRCGAVWPLRFRRLVQGRGVDGLHDLAGYTGRPAGAVLAVAAADGLVPMAQPSWSVRMTCQRACESAAAVSASSRPWCR